MMLRVYPLTVFLLAMFLCLNANAQETDFSSLDLDSDGTVTKDEFQEYVESKMPGFPFMDRFIGLVDANDDKEISEEEFASRMDHLEAIAQSENGEPEPEPESEEEMEEEEEYSELETEAVTAYKNIGKLMDEGEWETIPQTMTEAGSAQFSRRVVISALTILKMDINSPTPIDSLEQAQDAIAKVMETYGMDELEVPPRGEERNEVVDGVLDKDGKRWEIVAEILNARENTPFARNPLNSNIQEVETDEETVLLTVTEKANGAPGLQVIRPATVIRMVKVEDKWLYGGLDLERNREIAREFMENSRRRQRGGGKKSREESDF